MEDCFSEGDRVQISEDFFWAKGATGTVSSPPWKGGLSSQETSALGTNKVYWIWFDEPQYDADGDGPYRGGSIWEKALVKLTEAKQGQL
jgi:hypothetical protein